MPNVRYSDRYLTFYKPVFSHIKSWHSWPLFPCIYDSNLVEIKFIFVRFWLENCSKLRLLPFCLHFRAFMNGTRHSETTSCSRSPDLRTFHFGTIIDGIYQVSEHWYRTEYRIKKWRWYRALVNSNVSIPHELHSPHPLDPGLNPTPPTPTPSNINSHPTNLLSPPPISQQIINGSWSQIVHELVKMDVCFGLKNCKCEDISS